MTTKRIIVKPGNIFSAEVFSGILKYFQYIGNDETQLGSQVIRVFKQEYPVDSKVTLDSVLANEVEFHAHCFIKHGINMGLWNKMGQGTIHESPIPTFRDTYDFGRALWEEPIAISIKWVIWKMNQPMQNVGPLLGENQKADIGMVMSPVDIIDRMRNGVYNLTHYPAF